MQEATKKLQRVRVKLMRDPKWKALTGLFLLGNHTVVEGLRTASTDGFNTKYGKDYILNTSERLLRSTVLHETFHIMYKHLLLWKDLWEKDPHRTNAAMDFVINAQLVAAGEEVCESWLYEHRFLGMDVPTVYRILQDEGYTDTRGLVDEHDFENAKRLPESLAKEVDRALRQGAILSAGGNGALNLGPLLAPVVDWRKVLRDFVTTTLANTRSYSYARPRRRFLHQGMYFPTPAKSNSMDTLVAAIDTSGSTSSVYMRFLSELQEIVTSCTPSKLIILYWGSTIVREEEYLDEDVLSFFSKTKPVDGGGTDLACVFNYIREKKVNHSALLVLTDGQVYDWVEPCPKSTLFAITSKGITAPYGTTIHVTET